MADYKDIISGTIGSLVDKVKEVASSDSVRGIYEQGTSRAKIYGRIAKLGLEMNGDSEELKRVYTEIGKLYYEQAQDSPEGFFAPLFAQAGELRAKLSAKADEIEALKASVQHVEPDIDVEIQVEQEGDGFDLVVSATEEAAESPAAEDPEEPPQE